MRVTVRYPAAGLLGLAATFCALTGCGSGRDDLDVLPSEDKARAALEKALTAWQSGEKPGKLQGDSHAIEVVDKVWQDGGKLTSFEIVAPVDKPGPRWFSVRLTLKGARGPQQVSYAVLGLDPVWVYREEDYNKACGMGGAPGM
jgi:hypothetical protein